MALRSEHSAPTSHALSPRYNIAEIAEAVRQALPRCGDVRVITVDGLAGSGKSTLASLLSAELGDCPIVHLDDVYEGWTQDLNVKLAERTCAWILTPLRHGMPAHYMVFDWYQGRYTQWREIPMVPYLIKRVRENPGDPRAWRFLAQAYMSVNDVRDAARALAREIAIRGRGDAVLNSAYGEALVLQNGGQVPPEAEEAFNDALKVDPRNTPARFYLGLAKAIRRDNAGAVALWESLLADTPSDAPLHQMLVDRLAMLRAQEVSQGGGNGAPNPRAMVAMLAARLKADPNDALGWVRLMRAYSVLGETEKARQALADARKAFPDNPDAQTAFNTAAKALKLQ